MAIIKTLSSGAAAGVITVGLGLLMVGLIRVDFEAAPQQEALDFEINPVIDPIDNRPTIARLETNIRDIEIPPATPSIEIEKAKKPTETYTDVSDGIPEFPVPNPGPVDIVPVIMNQNPQPLVRFPGVMPRRALEQGISGHCKLRFGVTSSGSTYNLEAYYCTDKMFKNASISAASKFKYKPKIQNGLPVEMNGVTTKISYRMLDENGNVIPE